MPTQIAVPTNMAATPAPTAKGKLDDGATGSRKDAELSTDTVEDAEPEE